jgi:hypothetical protein
MYEMQYRQNKTNWISLGFFYGSEITNCQPFGSWITNGFNERAFRIRSWIDSNGVGIPDWWQLKYFGTVGIDGYGNPVGDGWNNIQKFQNGMNPFKWYTPAGPQGNFTFQEGADIQHENTVLTWRCDNGPVPDFFLIERADRTLRGMTNFARYRYMANGKILTNRPPPFLNPNIRYSRPEWQQTAANRITTNAFQVVAQVPAQPNIRDYHYTDTNVDAFPGPVYRVQAHFPKPALFAELNQVTTDAIRKTILSVSAEPQTDGYKLTVLKPIAHARYLLLVRDKNDRQWRASGYFVSGTNRNPVYLHADKKGMMTDTQSPIALPVVKFLPDVVQPEFTAGWGEDSDGDGLPDIYEVLVTHTKPDDADTGDTGILDGYKVFADDGWNNWEKFRDRANPFQKCEPPPAVVLKEPSLSEMGEAQTLKTDLPYESQMEIRTNGAAYFQPYSLSLDKNLPHDRYEHARCDVRISWKVPSPKP